MTGSKFVLQEECKSKIHIPKWALVVFMGGIFALMGLFLTLVGLSISEAHAATEKIQPALKELVIGREETQLVAQSLQIHLQVSAAKEQASLETLQDIRSELRLQRQEQQIMYKKLLELETLYHHP